MLCVWLVVILIELVLYCFNSEQLVVEIIFLMGWNGDIYEYEYPLGGDVQGCRFYQINYRGDNKICTLSISTNVRG